MLSFNSRTNLVSVGRVEGIDDSRANDPPGDEIKKEFLFCSYNSCAQLQNRSQKSKMRSKLVPF